MAKKQTVFAVMGQFLTAVSTLENHLPYLTLIKLHDSASGVIT
ncbi:hypothetical protein [Xenorhabdus poinarii]|nr:hypothetical protein [Xenorhabdus poinarii]